MNDPKQKTENNWLKRLTSIFKRDKTQKPKQKKEITSADRDKRGFIISLVTGGLMLVALVLYLIANKDKPPSFSDIRIYIIIMIVACAISAWLSRKGKTQVGASLILISLYITTIPTVLSQAGSGMALAAILMSMTLGITSAVFEPSIARRVNTIALVILSIPILLDIFEPISRPPDPTPGSSLALTIIIMLAYAAVVVRRFNTYNLRTKLIIAFGAVTILPLIALNSYNNSTLSDTLYQNAKEELGQLAHQTAIHVDTFIEERLSAMNTQAQNPPFRQFLLLDPTKRANSLEKTNAEDALTAFIQQDKSINTYTLLDDKGIAVVNAANAPGQNDRRTEFFKQAITYKRATVSGPFIDQRTGKASLYFSAPVKNQSGAVIGTLVLEYDANVIETIVEQQIPSGNPKSISFQIVTKDTFIDIANTTDSALLYKSYNDFTHAQITALQKQGLLLPGSEKNVLAIESETVTGLEKSDSTPFFTTTSGDKTSPIKYLNSATSLQSVPWLTFTRQPESAVLAPLAPQRRTSALIFLPLLVLVVLAGVGLSQLLASPILKLAATAQRIAAGDLTLQSDIESNDEIGVLATSFNQMTRQTRALINSLEQRSKALATSSEVSRRISTILDQQELVTEVVKQVQMAFGYYHAHIYLLDENTQQLIMAGGTGEAGKAMLARNHKIPMGKGLVGRAAQNNITVLVTNVAEEPQWLPNPLLPDTKSEVAVPIAIAERVLGVLDVQHNVADTLKQEDVDVLQSIANQVAFAVRNARSYSEVQAKADRESLISSIGQKIQGTITVESAMQVAIREIGRALNGAKTQVTLNENSITDKMQEENESDTIQHQK